VLDAQELERAVRLDVDDQMKLVAGVADVRRGHGDELPGGHLPHVREDDAQMDEGHLDGALVVDAASGGE